MAQRLRAAKVALFPRRKLHGPLDEPLVEEWKSHLAPPVRHDPVVSPQIPLPQTAHVKLQLINQSSISASREGSTVPGVPAKELIGAETGQ